MQIFWAISTEIAEQIGLCKNELFSDDILATSQVLTVLMAVVLQLRELLSKLSNNELFSVFHQLI